MRRFRFRLEKLHGHRQHLERAARLTMAEELAKLAELEERRRNIEESLFACRTSEVAGGMVSFARALERGLADVRRRVDAAVDAAEVRIEQARVAYQGRRRDLLAMDRLHERRLETWRVESAAEEQREFDDMARIRFVARSKEQ